MAERAESIPAARRLRALSEPTFVDFCAELWDARGYDVRVVDGQIRATRGDQRVVVQPRRRQFGAALRGRRHDDDVDVVVTPDDASSIRRHAERTGVRFVGPTALESLLRYGVDRARADDLFERYVGVSLTDVVAAPRNEERAPTLRAISLSTTRTVTTAVAVAGVVCLVLAGALGGIYAPGFIDESGESPSASTDEGSTGVAGATRTATSQGGPPGFGPDGFDARELARAHASTVDDTSYRLIVQHSGTAQLGTDGRWEGAWQQAVVEDNRTFLYSVVGYAANDSGGSTLVQFTVYADGNETYRRTDTHDGDSEEQYAVRITDSATDRGVFTELVGRYLVHYFTTSEARVEQPTWSSSPYRLVATGEPRYVTGDVTDYRATAMVDESGFVSSVSVSYSLHREGDSREVQFRFEYAGVGETTLTPPVWYEEAREPPPANATTPTGNGTTERHSTPDRLSRATVRTTRENLSRGESETEERPTNATKRPAA